MRTLAVAICLVALAAPAVAQTQTIEPVTGLRVLVLPSAGDSNTVTPVPNGTRETSISAASPLCNQPQVTASPSPLVNPGAVVIDDPFNAGRTCRVPFPTNLAEGQYRAVAQFLTAATSCEVQGASGGTQTMTPCMSVRSTVAVPPFSIVNVRVAPAAPTGVLLTK